MILAPSGKSAFEPFCVVKVVDFSWQSISIVVDWTWFFSIGWSILQRVYSFLGFFIHCDCSFGKRIPKFYAVTSTEFTCCYNARRLLAPDQSTNLVSSFASPIRSYPTDHSKSQENRQKPLNTPSRARSQTPHI
jgi:hypothetical protein